jgi:hypothetical protein
MDLLKKQAKNGKNLLLNVAPLQVGLEPTASRLEVSRATRMIVRLDTIYRANVTYPLRHWSKNELHFPYFKIYESSGS